MAKRVLLAAIAVAMLASVSRCDAKAAYFTAVELAQQSDVIVVGRLTNLSHWSDAEGYGGRGQIIVEQTLYSSGHTQPRLDLVWAANSTLPGCVQGATFNESKAVDALWFLTQNEDGTWSARGHRQWADLEDVRTLGTLFLELPASGKEARDARVAPLRRFLAHAIGERPAVRQAATSLHAAIGPARRAVDRFRSQPAPRRTGSSAEGCGGLGYLEDYGLDDALQRLQRASEAANAAQLPDIQSRTERVQQALGRLNGEAQTYDLFVSDGLNWTPTARQLVEARRVRFSPTDGSADPFGDEIDSAFAELDAVTKPFLAP